MIKSFGLIKYKDLKIVPVVDIPIGQEVPTDNLLEIFRIVTQMEHICTEQKGIGLSAVQVGLPLDLFIIERNNGYEYYLNCEYEGVGEKYPSLEGCLSLRDSAGVLKKFEVQRYSQVKIKGQQLKIARDPVLKLETVDRIEKGLYAVVFQHELDHQLGILISDIGKEMEIYEG